MCSRFHVRVDVNEVAHDDEGDDASPDTERPSDESPCVFGAPPEREQSGEQGSPDCECEHDPEQVEVSASVAGGSLVHRGFFVWAWLLAPRRRVQLAAGAGRSISSAWRCNAKAVIVSAWRLSCSAARCAAFAVLALIPSLDGAQRRDDWEIAALSSRHGLVKWPAELGVRDCDRDSYCGCRAPAFLRRNVGLSASIVGATSKRARSRQGRAFPGRRRAPARFWLPAG